MKMKKYTGWDRDGKSFTKQEFKNTHLKESGMSFKTYKEEVKRQKLNEFERPFGNLSLFGNRKKRML